MTTPVTIYDKSEKDRKKLRAFYICVLFLLILTTGVAYYWELLHHSSWPDSTSVLFLSWLLFTPVFDSLNDNVEITNFRIIRYDSRWMRSLEWSEVSGVEVDREHQKIIVTGTKQGKKRPISLVIKCPNGELDDVLSLLSKKLPSTSGATLQIPNSGLPTLGNVQEV